MGKVVNRWATLSQCSKSVVNAHRSPYGYVMRVLLDTLKLGHTGQVNDLRKLAVLLRNPQAGIGSSGHDVCLGVSSTQGQQLAQ
jgi:hypothetical protein